MVAAIDNNGLSCVSKRVSAMGEKSNSEIRSRSIIYN